MVDLSAIVVIGPCRKRARRVIDALCNQTAIDRMEVIVVDLADESIAGLELPTSVNAKYVRRPEIALFSQGRCVAMRLATAPIFAFTEDHCFPDPNWAAALIEAHRGPWAGIGYAFSNANPETFWSRMAMLNDYGMWMHPVLAEPATHLPGNNISYKRDILLQFDKDLETLLTPDYNLQHLMRSRGMQLRLEPAARTAHQCFGRMGPVMNANFSYARLLAARRADAEGWRWPRRLIQAVLTPPIGPFIGAVRQLRALRGRAAIAGEIIRSMPMYLFIHGCAAIGEMLGFLFGEGTAEYDWNQYELVQDRET